MSVKIDEVRERLHAAAKEYAGPLNCPACGGSGHVGDMQAQVIDLEQLRKTVADSMDFIAHFSWAWNGSGQHPNTIHTELQSLLTLIDGQPNPEPLMAPEDAACPILALAPAEYSYWEKRVWRRGVRDAESRKDIMEAAMDAADREAVGRIQQAVRDSQDGKAVQP